MPTDTLPTALPGFAEITGLPKNALADVELMFGYKIRQIVGTLGNALAVRAGHSTAPIALVWATQKGSDSPLLIASCLPLFRGKRIADLDLHTRYPPYGPLENTTIGKVLTLQEYTGGPHLETVAGTRYIPDNFSANLPDYSEKHPDFAEMKDNRRIHYQSCYNLRLPDTTPIADFENHGGETHFFTGRKFCHDKGLKIILDGSPCDPMDIIDRLKQIQASA